MSLNKPLITGCYCVTQGRLFNQHPTVDKRSNQNRYFTAPKVSRQITDLQIVHITPNFLCSGHSTNQEHGRAAEYASLG